MVSNVYINNVVAIKGTDLIVFLNERATFQSKRIIMKSWPDSLLMKIAL